MKRATLVFIVCVLAAAAGALAIRLARLGRPPMHGDEANQAVKAGALHDGGGYRYDPRDHHGPTLYYFTLPALWLSPARTFAETNERTFRIVPVLAGTAMILLLLLLGDGLGRPAAVCAGVLTAISPAMVYYSRYYIQEMLLVLFILAAVAAGWRYVRSGSVGWALGAGAFVGLTHATKETWIISFGAMLVALIATAVWTRRSHSHGVKTPSLVNGWHVAGAVAVACAVSAVLYSSFLANLRGPLDSLLAYSGYFERGLGGRLHTHPWHFYLHRLVYFKEGGLPAWSEGLIVGLSMAGLVAAATGRGAPGAGLPLLRFLTFYTVLTTVVYAALPYKTPWCMLPFLHGMILLAGVGAVAVVRWMPKRSLKALACVALAAGAVHLGRQAYRAAHEFYADNRNPYAYAHASTDVLRLAERVEQIARLHPDGHEMLVKVITPQNCWPLPWYLRRFNRVGWWEEVPDDPDAPVIVTSPDIQDALKERLRDEYQAGVFGLRPGVRLEVYVRKDLWDAFIADRAKAGGASTERSTQ